MSTETTKEQQSQTSVVLNWEPPMPPTDLIFDDGEPLESNRHRIAQWLRFYDQAGNLVPLPEEAAEEQGLQQGLRQGLEQGLQQGAIRQLSRLLTARFGSVPDSVEQSLRSLELNQLEELVEMGLTVNSIEEFISHLS